MNRGRETLLFLLKMSFAPSDFKNWFNSNSKIVHTHFPDYTLNSLTGVWDL